MFPLFIELGQVFAGRRLDAARLGQTRQKLLIALARLSSHDAPHRRVGLQRHVASMPSVLPFRRALFRQHLEYPHEHRFVRLHIDQPTVTTDRRVIRYLVSERVPQEPPQPQRVRRPPGNPALRVDPLKVADHHQTEVHRGGQRGTTHSIGVELATQVLDEGIEAFLGENMIHLRVEGMSFPNRQLRRRHPKTALILPLPLAHRHLPVLRDLIAYRRVNYTTAVKW